MDYKELSHTGGLEGMVTRIILFPELQSGHYRTHQPTGTRCVFSDQQPDQGRISWLPRKTGSGEMDEENNAYKPKGKRSQIPSGTEIRKTQNHPATVNFKIYAGRYRDPWLGGNNTLVSKKR